MGNDETLVSAFLAVEKLQGKASEWAPYLEVVVFAILRGCDHSEGVPQSTLMLSRHYPRRSWLLSCCHRVLPLQVLPRHVPVPFLLAEKDVLEFQVSFLFARTLLTAASL